MRLMIQCHLDRAYLYQLLIAIRSFTVLCDHSRSRTRLIAIMNLIAELEIIYATACHASLSTTALDCLNVSCHCRRRALTTMYKHSTGGEVGISESVAATAGALGLCKVLHSLPIIASKNTPFLPSSARQSYAHCCTQQHNTTTVLWPLVQDYQGELVPEETLTYPLVLLRL